jgi:hypothetical protein
MFRQFMILFASLACIFNTTCKQHGVVRTVADLNIDSIKLRVIEDGDVQAYNKLKKRFLEHDQLEALGFALIMANRHKYQPAFRDVADELMAWNQIEQADSLDLTKVDRTTRIWILKYLILASKAPVYGNSIALPDLKYKSQIEADLEEAQRQASLWETYSNIHK